MLTATEAAMDAGDELSTAAELHRLFPDIPDTVLLDLLDLARQGTVRLIEALERLTGDLSALEGRATAAGKVLGSAERRLGIPEP